MNKSRFSILGAMVFIGGCSVIPPMGGSTAPKVEAEQIVRKTQQNDGGCGLSIRTVNNLARNFTGVNASIFLLDEAHNMLGVVNYFEQTTLRGGSSSTYQTTIGVSCEAIARAKINYLSFQTPYGYYDPTGAIARIGENCSSLTRGVWLC